jgi:hypothetical protein
MAELDSAGTPRHELDETVSLRRIQQALPPVRDTGIEIEWHLLTLRDGRDPE